MTCRRDGLRQGHQRPWGNPRAEPRGFFAGNSPVLHGVGAPAGALCGVNALVFEHAGAKEEEKK